MGLIVDKPELLAALDQSDHDIRSQQAEARRAMSALNSLAGDASLDGRGWQAAKRHAADAAKPRLEAAVRQGDRVMADNAEFRQRLESLIADDYLDEDGIADCVARIRRNDSLLRQARDLLPADGGPLKVLIDRMRQQGEQQAARLEDKIRRLHTLDQTTRNLYQNATPQSGNGMGLGDLAAGGMSKTDMAEMFENEYGMSKEQAEQLAEFTIRFHAYAKEQGWNSQQEAYEYACIIGSIGYGPDSGGDGGKLWGIAANTMSHDQLISMLAAIGYPKGKKDNPKIGTAEYFINDMLLFHQGKDEHEKILKHPAKVDFVHEMASLAAMLNTDPKSALYHEGTSIFIPNPLNPKMPVKLPSNYREAATWGGDIASGSMDADDLHADMDAINLQQRLTEHPSQDPMKILNDYNRRVEHDPRRRADEFLGNYDPTGGHDPDKGMAWLKGTAGAQSFLPPGDVALGLDALRKGLDPAKTYRFFFQTLDRERGR